MAEYLDIVDTNGNIVGKDTRANLHKSPDKIHMTVNILIVNSKGEILVQQRSKNKKFGPGIWEISAGGHVESGSTPDETAKKELKEELGIEVELKFIEKKVFKFPEQSELAHLYVGYSDGPFCLEENEIERVHFVGLDKLDAFLMASNSSESMLGYWMEVIKAKKDMIFKNKNLGI
ncbi:NUDIX domain-containing protein [Candidatus Dojkabacteria bacterium]|nr:NUDIX domain-containing protein [Candidatus Dojkabacteria bacterium]